jgi:predicted nuclease of predicted toxin-antitoxin system
VTPLLLDANLSPETSAFLRALGLDVTDLSTRRLTDLTDLEIVALTRREKRTIVTFDLDFGEIYYRTQRGQIGVIILRLGDQTIEAVNAVLGQFFPSITPAVDLATSLIVIDEHQVRIIT